MFFERAPDTAGLAALLAALGGAGAVREKYYRLMAGIPGAARHRGDALLNRFLATTGFEGAVLDIRRVLGEFASATAAAAAVAVGMVGGGRLTGGGAPAGKGVLMIGFGDIMTAMEIMPP